jgi:elongation factor G
VGHGGVGKTSLVESILLTAGATTRLGKVDDGTTATDFDPDEIKRRFPEHRGGLLRLLGLPPQPDRHARVWRVSWPTPARRPRGGRHVVVVDAVAGVQVRPRRSGSSPTSSACRVIVINRLDRERADFTRTRGRCRSSSRGGSPFQVPIGGEAGFAGIVDPDRDEGPHLRGRQGDGRRDRRGDGHWSSLIERSSEAAAETDDDLLAKYLEEGSIRRGRMLDALRKAVLNGAIVPVLAASAVRGIGVVPLLELILKEFPSPADRGQWRASIPDEGGGHARPRPQRACRARVQDDPRTPMSASSRSSACSGTFDPTARCSTPRGRPRRIGHLGWLMGETQSPSRRSAPARSASW